MTDFYIKDEGYADVKVHTNQKAKEWCHKNGYENSLTYFGKTWCSEPVWYPGMNEGFYKFAIKVNKVENFIKKVKAAGFTVESEF